MNNSTYGSMKTNLNAWKPSDGQTVGFELLDYKMVQHIFREETR